MSRRSSSRARRRDEARKAVERARKILRAQFASRSDVDLAEVDALARRLADHLASCSCPLCGNPRKWSGEHSLQELRAALDEHDDS